MDDDKPETNCKRSRKEEPSILEMLREYRVPVVVANDYGFRSNKKDQQRVMELILEHRSKFPSKVRPAIVSAAWGEDGNSNRTKPAPSNIFLQKVYSALWHFFFGGTIIDGEPDTTASEEWHGLDQRIDTEDEVEVAIRFFPRVLLVENTCAVLNYCICRPINWLMTSAKAVSFAPLFLRLDVEFYPDRFLKDGRKYMSFMGHYYSGSCRDEIQRQLFVNRYPNSRFGEISSPELDRESLLALRKLKEMGLVNKKELVVLLRGLFESAETARLDASFVATRFQLLMEWDPSVWLELATIQHEVLPVSFLSFSNKWTFQGKDKEKLRVCEDMLKVAIHSFPLKLGLVLVFHKERTMGQYAELFGRNRLSEMVHEAIGRVLREHETFSLREWVAAVAANKEISPVGLYTLIRYNPVEALIPKGQHLPTGA